MLSTMTANKVDATNLERIAALGQRVLGGKQITRDEAVKRIVGQVTAAHGG